MKESKGIRPCLWVWPHRAGRFFPAAFFYYYYFSSFARSSSRGRRMERRCRLPLRSVTMRDRISLHFPLAPNIVGAESVSWPLVSHRSIVYSLIILVKALLLPAERASGRPCFRDRSRPIPHNSLSLPVEHLAPDHNTPVRSRPCVDALPWDVIQDPGTSWALEWGWWERFSRSSE